MHISSPRSLTHLPRRHARRTAASLASAVLVCGVLAGAAPATADMAVPGSDTAHRAEPVNSTVVNAYNGYYLATVRNSATNYVITVDVNTWAYATNWKFTRKSDGYYTIARLPGGRCVTYETGSDYLYPKNCVNGTNQDWSLRSAGSGMVTIHPRNAADRSLVSHTPQSTSDYVKVSANVDDPRAKWRVSSRVTGTGPEEPGS